MEELQHKLQKLMVKEGNDNITLEATVATGFENTALKEVLHKINVAVENTCVAAGRLYFNINSEDFQKVSFVSFFLII